MIVCLCTGVPDSTVRRMLAGGTDTVEALSAACGAGSSCGACYPMLEDLLAEARAGSDSLTAVHAAA
jgi:bacterioferritin-associated ferredoxin